MYTSSHHPAIFILKTCSVCIFIADLAFCKCTCRFFFVVHYFIALQLIALCECNVSACSALHCALGACSVELVCAESIKKRASVPVDNRARGHVLELKI